MLTANIPWNLKDVLFIHLLRLAVGLLLVRLVYPLLFTATPFTVELTDRVVILILVGLALRKYRVNPVFLGVSGVRFWPNLVWGLAAGGILLGVSIFSERIYATALLLTPAQHPLVVLVKNASTWQELSVPLVLAGIAAPVAEETLYRLFTFLPMKERWGLWGGAFISAIIFALMHFNLYWLPEMVIVGMGLAMVYYWSGSLFSAIVAHAFINTSKILLLFWGFPLS
ncbi:caax protease self-immunity [Lucifera butyrica]|uniref:Caax protease self-immunity n=1 Tax=Lucifera butyrica TaxID=1351585 RepID=A0A498RC36_9FIRM|nr:type II CAAX endopeptidase family protein [Lucifera butyrica]VBB08555.1 caax protease self-immunity [Lucifera butyrica]